MPLLSVVEQRLLDLHRWQESVEQLIANALQPAAILQVILHPVQHRAVVVVEADQVSLANGRRGENRELASRLWITTRTPSSQHTLLFDTGPDESIFERNVRQNAMRGREVTV
jgi:hypothetical protein